MTSSEILEFLILLQNGELNCIEIILDSLSEITRLADRVKINLQLFFYMFS